MVGITRPMLAPHESCDPDKLRYPVAVSPKLDGIRCLVLDGTAFTRSFKPQPNRWIQANVRRLPEGLDGELMLATPGATFQDVTSAVMSREGTPNFIYYVFDLVVNPTESFLERFKRLKTWHAKWIADGNAPWVKVVPHSIAHNPAQVRAFEERCLKDGFEGVMVRDLEGPYKCGRSTSKEGYLLKLKRYSTAEGVVVALEEGTTNLNEPFVAELGQTKRSTAKEGKLPSGTLGNLVLKMADGRIVRVGTGFTAAERQEIWGRKPQYIGRLGRFKFQNYGVKDLPRQPVWDGWRDRRDV